MEKLSPDEQPGDVRPTPDDIVSYLPWACNQLQLDSIILVTKVFQNDYVSAALTDRSKKPKSKPKLTQSRHEVGSDQEKEEKSVSGLPQLASNNNVVRLLAIYDSGDNLVEIKFIKNINIPRKLLIIIGLIIPFHQQITKIVINGGMDMYTLYEINKFLNRSNISEICLDDSFLKEANYEILLETANSLRHLSLSRCRIDDVVIGTIAKKLIYPMPASKSLYVLNLSSNSITDLGAGYLGNALRTNRQLSYLSLADNRLSDDGAGKILDVLIEFPLSCDEILESRQRHMLFLNHKNELIDIMIKELRAGEFDKRAQRRKSTRPTSSISGKKGKIDKDSSLKSIGDVLGNMDSLYYDKAVNMVENILGEFVDPYNTSDIVVKDGVVYSKGNNSLCFLNLAYNSLSYISVKKLLSVLMFQKLQDRKPRGLINLSIEGNNLPVTCKEFSQLDDILDTGLMVHNRRMSVAKKKIQSKTTSR